MAVATMTSKGQITVPKEVREALGLSAGRRVRFSKIGAQRFEIVPADLDDLDSLFASLHHDGTVVTLDEMRDAIAEGAIESGR